MSNRPNTKLIVVYVNYLGRNDLVRSITSLTAHVAEPLHIVVVDNSPVPDCESLPAQFPETDIQVILAQENLGFAGGCNLGVRSAPSDWTHVLFFNPDAYCDNDFISPLLEAMNQDNSWGILTPRIYADTQHTETWFAGSTMHWWRGGPRHVYDERFSDGLSPVSVPFASGCCSLMRRETWDVAGELDDSYFLYFEDADYVEKVKRAGFKIGYLPKQHIVHEESKSTGYQSPMFLYYFARNRIRYARRWSPKSQLVLFYCFLFCVKIPGSWLVFGLMQRQPRKAYAFNVGTLHGLLDIQGAREEWHRKQSTAEKPE